MPPKKKTPASGGAAAPKGHASVPTLLLMCGLPASGKSTFSGELGVNPEDAARKLPVWIRVSPDDLGTMEECKRTIAKQLKHRGSVVLDRCNASSKERQMFIREAKEFGPVNVELLYFDVPADVCIARAKARKNHPTLDPNNAEKVINQFAATFRAPESIKEGPYTAMHRVNETTSSKHLRALLLHYREVGVTGPRAFVPPAES